MANEVLNAIERNLRAFRHVSQETEPAEKELGSTWYVPSKDITYKWVNNAGILQWEVITGRRIEIDSVDPTVNDDASSGFDIGSVWINSVTNYRWTLVNSTTGSALWRRSVDISGDTMEGPLSLSADPVANMEATTKQYVDAAVGAGLTVEDTQDLVADMFNVVHSGITATYDDPNGTITLDVNDPTVSISGAASGSSVMTNLGDTDINVSISSINNIDDISTAGSVAGDVLIYDGTSWNNEDTIDAGNF